MEAVQTVSMERRVPELDFVTECDNRVWGCNSKENVIYGCKLGDPTNWFSYRGIAADSYAVTVGSDGAFTGAASCMGYALFFKENTLHKLYGSKPSDFQLSSLRCRGVAKNAARSLEGCSVHRRKAAGAELDLGGLCQVFVCHQVAVVALCPEAQTGQRCV